MLKATLRSFLAHKGRLLLSALAVVLSVAFVAGSLIFSDTVSRTFDRLFASTAADVTVEPKDDLSSQLPSGAVRTLPASLAARIAAVDGVASAHADVSVDDITLVDSRNRLVGSTTGAPTIARDWHPTDRSPVRLTSGHAPHGDGEALLDADTAGKKHLRIGDTLTVLARPGSFRVRIVGIATFTTTNPGAALVYLDPSVAARKLLGAADRATAVSATAAPGVDDARLKARIAAALGDSRDSGGGLTLRTADERAKSSAEQLGTFLDVIKYVMLGFAGIAVLVGVFLIVNTFAMLVAQRTRELGLLRALGADRRQVRRSVLTEAVLLGVAGSTVGLAAGIGLAVGLIRLMSVFGMNLRTAEMVVGWATPVTAYVVGVGVTFVAACLPARRAAAVSPMAALQDAEIADVGRPLRARAVAGGIVGAAGAAALAGCAASGQTATAASLLGLGVVLTLIATVVAGPLLVRPVIRVLGAAFPALFGPVGRMSQRNALRNPRRTGATAAALMVGLALVGGMSVASASMSRSFDEQIDRTLGGGLRPAERQLHAVPAGDHGQGARHRRGGPGRTAAVRAAGSAAAGRQAGGDHRGRLRPAAGRGRPCHLHRRRLGRRARPRPPRHGRRLRQGPRGADGQCPAGRVPRRPYGAADGGRAHRPGPGGRVRHPGRAVHGTVHGGAVHPRGSGLRAVRERRAGRRRRHAEGALERTLKPYPQVQVRDLADYKDLVHDQIAVLLYLVYALLGLAIVIAVLGVVNTLALSVVERTREIGLLRAIGLSRRQLRRMIRLESVVIAVFGAVLGLALGLLWGCAHSGSWRCRA
ncbi:hypothetical protein GCM10020256_67320 [Streptomyces thermocoprophilus]